MRFSISDFKHELARRAGPTRGHLFRCSVYEPNFFAEPTRNYLLCRSVTVPPQTITPIELKYHTRTVKIPGERTYPPITLTFINTGDYMFRHQFLQWHGVWSSYRTNARGVRDSRTTLNQESTSIQSPTWYGRIVLEHFAEYSDDWWLDVIEANIMPTFVLGEHTLLGTYVLEDAFPSSVGGLEFAQDAGEFQTYDVEFQYQYMEFIGPTTGTETDGRIVIPPGV